MDLGETALMRGDVRLGRAKALQPTSGYWRLTARRLARDPIGAAAAVVMCFCIFLGLTAPFLATHWLHHDPARQDLDHTFAPPSRTHLLGTDELGRDTLTRLVYGARVSIGIGLLTVLISGLTGATVGVIGGSYGGLLDDALMRLVDLLKGLPAIYVFIFMSILLRPNVLTLSFVIAFIGWANVARLVRGDTLTVGRSEFVTAAMSLGASRPRIIMRHIVPHIVPTLVVAASLGFGQAILAEAALDFLGLGIAPPTASWGNMLQNAQSYFAYSWLLVVAPGLLIFVTVLGAAILGNALRDASDPKLRTIGP